ncbi:keratin-associated protein 5-5-like [Helianthus annuus]|uniref:keratin-associated protein 5-5-like n=1 Tax=Helianthus annuus TaxID=4232 RepID=UPI0016530638|nr:keratin-associated protein 5-5-like [Helianthus annuus]
MKTTSIDRNDGGCGGGGDDYGGGGCGGGGDDGGGGGCGGNGGCGMGAYCPPPVLTQELQSQVMSSIILSTVKGKSKEGCKFVRVLYALTTMGAPCSLIYFFAAKVMVVDLVVIRWICRKVGR